MNGRNVRFLALAACAVLASVAIACGDDDDDGDDGAETPSGADGSVVAVQLAEFSVIPDPSTAAAGEVTFRATNDGPDDPHELVIIKTDLAPDALPTAEDGSVPEEEVDIVDEIEEFPVGETRQLTVDLEAGAYVLICNLVEEEEGEIESHYALGMRRAFTVE